MMSDRSLKRLPRYVTEKATWYASEKAKRHYWLCFYWITDKITTGSSGYKSIWRGRELRRIHIGHTQWVSKSRSLGCLGGWGKNLGRRTMVFHQMIQIMMRNLRLTQKDPYANVTSIANPTWRPRYIRQEVLVLPSAHLSIPLGLGRTEGMKGSFSSNIYISYS
jgi:hypothetical protein